MICTDDIFGKRAVTAHHPHNGRLEESSRHFGNVVLFEPVAYRPFHEDGYEHLHRPAGKTLCFGVRVLPDSVGWDVLVAIGEPALNLGQIVAALAGQLVERALLRHLTHRLVSPPWSTYQVRLPVKMSSE
jgi:hypothetical protein